MKKLRPCPQCGEHMQGTKDGKWYICTKDPEHLVFWRPAYGRCMRDALHTRRSDEG